MGGRADSRPTRRALTGMLWASVLLAVATLPTDRFPLMWLLAFALPAWLFLGLQPHRRMATSLTIAGLAQLLAGYGALHLAGPLDETAALACTLLPPLAYVTVRRQDTDILLALFLSFCTLLVGLMLGGPTVTLPAYLLTAALTLRLETVLDLLQTRTSHWVGSGRVLRGRAVLLSLACGLACLGFYPLLSHLPTLTTQAAQDLAAGPSLGPSPSFELSTPIGTPLNLSQGELLRVRSLPGGSIPPDLYLRCAFFDVPGMDRWNTEPFQAQVRDTRTTEWHMQRARPGARTRSLEIQRLGGFGGLVFAPPGTTAIIGLDRLHTEPSREWLRQETDAGMATYQVEYQDLRRLVAGQATDSRWRGLRSLPSDLRGPPFTQILAGLPPGAQRNPSTLARALSELIQQRCTYALQEPVGPYSHVLLNFLNGTQRRGYCMHFASALGVLLRLAGIPCRVAVGLQGGEPDPDHPEVRTFDARHAHAWVEIPFPRLGWVVFDPTPPALLQGTGEALIPDLAEATAQAGGVEPSGDRAGTFLGGYLDTAASQFWIWSLLLLLWLCNGLRPRLRATGMPSMPRAGPARNRLERILKTLRAHGLPRSRGQTLERYLEDLHRGAHLDETVLADAFAAYQEVRFGTGDWDVGRTSRLEGGLVAAREARKRETG